MVEKLLNRAVGHDIPCIRQESALLLARMPRECTFSEWLKRRPEDAGWTERVKTWLKAGERARLLGQLSRGDAQAIAALSIDAWRYLVQGGCAFALEDAEHRRVALLEALEGRLSIVGQRGAYASIEWMTMPHRFFWPMAPDELPVLDQRSIGGMVENEDSLALRLNDELAEVFKVCVIEGRVIDSGEISLAMERLLGFASWRSMALALLSIRGRPTEGFVASDDGWSVSWARNAWLHKATPSWWSMELGARSGRLHTRAWVTALLMWGTPSVLERNLEMLEEALSSFEPFEYQMTLGMSEIVGRGGGSSVLGQRLPARAGATLISKARSARGRLAIGARCAGDVGLRVGKTISEDDALSDSCLVNSVMDALLFEILSSEDFKSWPPLLKRLRALMKSMVWACSPQRMYARRISHKILLVKF